MKIRSLSIAFALGNTFPDTACSHSRADFMGLHTVARQDPATRAARGTVIDVAVHRVDSWNVTSRLPTLAGQIISTASLVHLWT